MDLLWMTLQNFSLPILLAGMTSTRACACRSFLHLFNTLHASWSPISLNFCCFSSVQFMDKIRFLLNSLVVFKDSGHEGLVTNLKAYLSIMFFLPFFLMQIFKFVFASVTHFSNSFNQMFLQYCLLQISADTVTSSYICIV